MGKLNRLAIIDGVSRGLSLKIITDFAFSSLCGCRGSIFAILLYVFAGIGLPAFFIARNDIVRLNINRYYLISCLAFLCALAIIFINALTLHFNFFPIRETSNADGLIAILGFAVYFSLNLISRLTGYSICKARSKKENKA